MNLTSGRSWIHKLQRTNKSKSFQYRTMHNEKERKEHTLLNTFRVMEHLPQYIKPTLIL